MINKNKIKIIIKNLTTNRSNNNKPIFFFSSIKKLDQKTKKKRILIFYRNRILISFIKVFFYLLYTKVKFKKNCFLLFNPEENIFIGHNILPDWPGRYSKNNFFKNILIWVEKFIYIFIFRKRLTLIFIKIF